MFPLPLINLLTMFWCLVIANQNLNVNVRPHWDVQFTIWRKVVPFYRRNQFVNALFSLLSHMYKFFHYMGLYNLHDWKRKKKPIINKIHIIMSELLLFKELAIICAFPRLYIREINWYSSWLGCSICAFLVLQGYTAFQCHCPYRNWIIVLPLQVLEYIANAV